MKKTLQKTAAFLLIFAFVFTLSAAFALGETAQIGALKRGDSGEEVAALQRDLRALGLISFSGEPSGEFDGEVELAVMELQRLIGVEVDGIYGVHSRRGFLAAVENGTLEPVYVEKLPLYGCTIGIDAGHQGEADQTLEPIAPGSAMLRYAMTDGCFGIRTNTPESLINLDISLILSDLLSRLGAEVVSSRESNEVSISNAKRAELMNSSGVDFWLRIHCDHSSDPTLFGARILVPNSIRNLNISVRSAFLGRCIITNFCAAVGTVSLLSRSLTGETGFNWSSVPVAALELGYLSNAASDLALSNPEYRRRCAEGVLFGIAEYYYATHRITFESYCAITGVHKDALRSDASIFGHKPSFINNRHFEFES